MVDNADQSQPVRISGRSKPSQQPILRTRCDRSASPDAPHLSSSRYCGRVVTGPHLRTLQAFPAADTADAFQPVRYLGRIRACQRPKGTVPIGRDNVLRSVV